MLIVILFMVFIQSISNKVHAYENYDRILSSANTFDYDTEHLSNQSHYKMDQRNSNYVDDEVLLTVINPGLGGDISHFVPIFDTNGEMIKVSDKNNIVSALSECMDNKVIIKYAKMNYLSIRIEDITQFFIDEYEYNSSYHTIVLFEAAYAYDTNDDVYSQFDKAVSKVVNEIKENNDGLLPKVNLIGHSRGGLINLLYAMDHPDMVNQIFSMGTPYVGSTTAKIDVEYNNCEIGSGDESTNGEKDIVNEELYKSYKERWNSNYSLYKHINVYAMGGSTTYGFLEKLLTSKKMEDYRDKFGMSKGIFNSLRFIAADQLFRIEMQSVQYSIFHTNGWDNLTKSLIGALGTSNNDDLNLMTALLATLENESEYKGIKKRLVWMNDGLVDLKSQLGEGYRGFKNYTKIFSPYNCDMGNCADPEQLPVVHNLEVKDKAFINYICKNIEMDERNYNNPNYISRIIKPEYLTYEIDENSVGIYSYLGNDTVVDIPSEIKGKIVKEIGYGAFQSNDDVIKITIPSNVEIIKDYAFSDCTKLEEINVIGNIKDLAYTTSFAGCESLLNINIIDSSNYRSYSGILYNKDMTCLYKYPEGRNESNFVVPTSVIEIDSNAFYNANIRSINLNNVINVEANAFLGCASLSTIIGNKVVYVGENAFNETLWYQDSLEDNSGLIVIGKTIIGYSSTDDEIILDYNDLEGIESISSNSFSNIETLTIYIPANVKIINSNAFVNINNLKIYVSMPYNNINEIFNYDETIVFNCTKELKDYYEELIELEINVFDGVDVDKAYVIKKFIEYTCDDDLYVGEVLYKLYEGETLDITKIYYKNSDTGYYTYYLESLYYDNKCQNSYESNIIGYDDVNEYWAKWAYFKYRIIYDYNRGYSYNNKTVEEIDYNYYTDIGIPFGHRLYCDDILYWLTDDGKRYFPGREYYMANFISSGLDKEDREITLTAVWQQTKYKITYHYNGFAGRYDTFTGYYHYYDETILYKPIVNGYVYLGWYNRADVDENECDYSYEYINGFKEHYYGAIELYCKWYKNGNYTTTNEYKITDSGRYKQSYDIINLYEVLKIGVSELKEFGYIKIQIKMEITLRELDNGTQHVFFYKSAYSDDNDLITSYDITDANSKDSTKSQTITIYLSDLKCDMLFIRFGASGSFDDDWKTSYRKYTIKVVE